MNCTAKVRKNKNTFKKMRQREEIEHEERRQADEGVYRDTRMDVWSSSHMVQPGS